MKPDQVQVVSPSRNDRTATSIIGVHARTVADMKNSIFEREATNASPSVNRRHLSPMSITSRFLQPLRFPVRTRRRQRSFPVRAINQVLASCSVLMCICAISLAGDEPVKANANNSGSKQQLFKISKKTTYLEGPLTDEGFVNYVKAIEDEYGKGVTPENNFAVVYWQTVGPAAIQDAHRQRFFKRLGIEPLSEEGNYYMSLEAMRERQLARNPNNERDLFEQHDSAAGGPWSPQESPELAEWLRINQKHLDRLAEATKRERFFSPVPMADEENPPPVIAMLLPALQGLREIADGLRTRAMLRLNSRDVEGAWNDLLACHRLARLAAQHPTLIGDLVGISINAIAVHGDAYLAQHSQLTLQQVLRIRQEFLGLPKMLPMAGTIDRAERFTFLDIVSVIASGKVDVNKLTDVGGKALGNVLTNEVIDWNTVLEMGNDWFDRLVDAFKQPTFAQRKLAFAEIEKEMKGKRMDLLRFQIWSSNRQTSRQAMSRKVGSVLIALLTPAVEQAREAENRSTMRIHLLDVAFALTAYRIEHGQYPERLEALVPKYLAKIPQDLYTDDTLKYRVVGKDYLLYSVGSNMRDDKGQTFDSQPPADDIVISRHPRPNKADD